MSAVSPQGDSVLQGVWWWVLCHGLGRMVNNLTIPPALFVHGQTFGVDEFILEGF
jgi:hypothetical protein